MEQQLDREQDGVMACKRMMERKTCQQLASLKRVVDEEIMSGRHLIKCGWWQKLCW